MPPKQISASAATFIGPVVQAPLPAPVLKSPMASLIVPKSVAPPVTRLFAPPIIAGSGPCSGVNCGPGLTCVDGRCVDAACVGVLCPPGQQCVGGKCVGPVPEVGASGPQTFVAPTVDPSAKVPPQPTFALKPAAPAQPTKSLMPAASLAPTASKVVPTSGPGPVPLIFAVPTAKDTVKTVPLSPPTGGRAATNAAAASVWTAPPAPAASATAMPTFTAPTKGVPQRAAPDVTPVGPDPTTGTGEMLLQEHPPGWTPPAPAAAPIGLLAGGAVGFFVGGPIGAAVGALLGSFLGGQPAAPATPPVGYWR